MANTPTTATPDLELSGALVPKDQNSQPSQSASSSDLDLSDSLVPKPAEQPSVFSRAWSGVKQSLDNNIGAPIRGAFAPADPKDAKEIVVNAAAGQGGVAAYRLAKNLVDATEAHFKAPKESFENAKQDLVRAVGEFHNGDWKNGLATTGSIVADTNGMLMMPGAAQARELTEGARPGGNLATPLAKDATDLGLMAITEKAPEALASVGKAAQKIAPESMNTLLRANKESNYLYGKVPGKAFIDEGIKIPKNSVTMAGQLENLHGQLETASDNLSQQINSELSDPAVASKRLDVVPTVKGAIADAKKFISKQTGLDVPSYVKQLNDLEDNILTRYDSNGNPTGKVTGTKLAPAEVADVKKSIGKNTQWKVSPLDPDIKLKSYLNTVRKQIYGQLADMVESAAPNSNIKELNGRFANVIEAQGLLEKRLALEHGTGGINGAIRKAEFWGGLASALFSPEPISKTLGAGAVADRVIRSVPGKMATAKTLNKAGQALQSPAIGNAASAAQAAIGTRIASKLGGPDPEDGEVPTHVIDPEQGVVSLP
jgi:hypothetical protein